MISGRSDATLNRGGVRLGTSDFYAVVERFDEVVDSLVVHLDPVGDEDDLGRLVLFVTLAADTVLDDDLAARLRAALRSELSPRHVPDLIEAAPVVPRTLSGKKLEVPIKRILQGAEPDAVASKDALADPTSLAWYGEQRGALGGRCALDVTDEARRPLRARWRRRRSRRRIGGRGRSAPRGRRSQHRRARSVRQGRQPPMTIQGGSSRTSATGGGSPRTGGSSRRAMRPRIAGG